MQSFPVPHLDEEICTHDPSTSQVSKSYHSHPVPFPYPPDPGEHVLEASSAPTTLVERDKLDLSSLIPPKGEMKSSFSWTCPFKSPTSNTLCFGEPTLGKINQETDVYMTKHMPKPSSGAKPSFRQPLQPSDQEWGAFIWGELHT